MVFVFSISLITCFVDLLWANVGKMSIEHLGMLGITRILVLVKMSRHHGMVYVWWILPNGGTNFSGWWFKSIFPDDWIWWDQFHISRSIHGSKRNYWWENRHAYPSLTGQYSYETCFKGLNSLNLCQPHPTVLNSRRPCARRSSFKRMRWTMSVEEFTRRVIQHG